MGKSRKNEEKKNEGKKEKVKREVKRQVDYEHVGFHTISHEGGLWYGNGDPTACSPIIRRCTIAPYTLRKIDDAYPFVYFDINGFRGHCQASEFAGRLRALGYPISKDYQVRQLTEFIVHEARSRECYHEPGYSLEIDNVEMHKRVERLKSILGNVSEDEIADSIDVMEADPPHILKLITHSGTQRAIEGSLPYIPSLDEVSETLFELYDATSDKKAFIVAFSYALFAPLAPYIRSKRLFFPNLLFMGYPESGKNSLLNLFMGKMWGVEDNIKVTGDFRTEFASMVNLGGSGLPIVINDLDQESYEKLRPYLLEGAMNPKGGSRGRASLEIQHFETLRGICVSANYLRIGGPEFASRFLIHVLESVGEDPDSWNSIAAKLENGMYPVARLFVDYVNSISVDAFLGYFKEGRLNVKKTMIEIGAQILQRIFQKVSPSFTIPRDYLGYEEYREDELSIFVGWVQMQYRRIEKETSIYQGYSDEHGAKILELPEKLMYIKRKDNVYTIFGSAWNDFLHSHKEFPYRNMSLFAHAFPGVLEVAQRKFKEPDKPDKPRTTYYVLLLKSEYEEPPEEIFEKSGAGDPQQKKLREVNS